MFHPYKLWSLWDMLRVFADDFINIGGAFALISRRLLDAEEDNKPFTDEHWSRFKSDLLLLKSECDKMGLKLSSAILLGTIGKLPITHRELEMLMDLVKEEIKSNLFLYVPMHRSKYYGQEIDNLSESFKNASNELIHAGNCYATGEYTACVFHSMRAAEIGLRTLATYLTVTFPFPIELADWKNIIDKVESEIKAKQQLPKGAAKDEELRFCSEAATHFRYLKDAFRIFVAHARAIYDEGEALRIMEHTGEFLKGLSGKIIKPGP
jgi:hypothetical protein